MGGNGSKLVKKIVSPFGSSADKSSSGQSGALARLPSPFVLTRQGSMFFDEDGDLAHEFYIEVPPPRKGEKATMKRIFTNLTPQGEVKLPFPRLHPDYPVIMYQA